MALAKFRVIVGKVTTVDTEQSLLIPIVYKYK